MDIQGRAAIVTGGASGLGEATAILLTDRGAKVLIIDTNAEAGERLAIRLNGLFAAADVSDEAAVADALSRAEAAHGPARILVNCAGIAPASRTVARDGTAHSLALFRKTIEVNLIGTFNLASQFAARLNAAEPIGEETGVIVNTASVAAYEGQIGQTAYAASKGGVAALTLPLARDLAQLRIRAVAIAPGLFLTPMMQAFPEDVQHALGAQVPHPARLGRPEEYAQMVEAIITNPMLNGEVIRLDGAIRMAPR